MKIGDKVKCINAKIKGFPPAKYLTLNETYTVKNITAEISVTLEEIQTCSYDTNRFETINQLRKKKLIKLNKNENKT